MQGGSSFLKHDEAVVCSADTLSLAPVLGPLPGLWEGGRWSSLTQVTLTTNRAGEKGRLQPLPVDAIMLWQKSAYPVGGGSDFQVFLKCFDSPLQSHCNLRSDLLGMTKNSIFGHGFSDQRSLDQAVNTHYPKYC